MTKEEIVAPTVMLDSLSITATIEIKEGQHVNIMDLPGAFLHVSNEDDVIKAITGKWVKLMAINAPQIYWRNITSKNKENQYCI